MPSDYGPRIFMKHTLHDDPGAVREITYERVSNDLGMTLNTCWLAD